MRHKENSLLKRLAVFGFLLAAVQAGAFAQQATGREDGAGDNASEQAEQAGGQAGSSDRASLSGSGFSFSEDAMRFPEWPAKKVQLKDIPPPPPLGPYMSSALNNGQIESPRFSNAAPARAPAVQDLPAANFSPDMPWPGDEQNTHRWMPESGYQFVPPVLSASNPAGMKRAESRQPMRAARQNRMMSWTNRANRSMPPSTAATGRPAPYNGSSVRPDYRRPLPPHPAATQQRSAPGPIMFARPPAPSRQPASMRRPSVPPQSGMNPGRRP